MAEKVKTNTFQWQPVASDLGVSWRLARDASLPGAQPMASWTSATSVAPPSTFAGLHTFEPRALGPHAGRRPGLRGAAQPGPCAPCGGSRSPRTAPRPHVGPLSAGRLAPPVHREAPFSPAPPASFSWSELVGQPQTFLNYGDGAPFLAPHSSLEPISPFSSSYLRRGPPSVPLPAAVPASALALI